MQVSWIEAEEIREYIAKLVGPPTRTSHGTFPDLNTLPESSSIFKFDLVPQKPRGVKWQPTLEAEANAAPPGGSEGPDVTYIREKLRMIRDRAQQAGLLSAEAPRPAPAPEPSPIQPAAPEVSPAPPPAQAPIAEAQPATSRAVEIVPVQATAAPVPTPAAVAPLAAPAPSPPPAQSTIAERLDEFAQWATRQTTSEELFMLDEYGDLIWGAPTQDDLIIFARLALNATQRTNAATLAQASTPARMQIGSGKELQLVTCPTLHGNVAVAMVNPKQVAAATLREALALAIEKKGA